MSEEIKIGPKSSIPSGMGKVVQAGQRTLAVFNVDGTFHAVDNTCKHRGGPLGEGELEGTVVTCPWHGWQYDVATGVCLGNPATKLTCFPVKLQGEELVVSV